MNLTVNIYHWYRVEIVSNSLVISITSKSISTKHTQSIQAPYVSLVVSKASWVNEIPKISTMFKIIHFFPHLTESILKTKQ